MESFGNVINISKPGVYMASVDLKDAFCSIPINPIRGGGGGIYWVFLYNFLYHKATVLIFFGKYLNLYTNYPNSGWWSIQKKKKVIFFFSNMAYYIFLERKFNFQYNGENCKSIAYPEQKLFKF